MADFAVTYSFLMIPVREINIPLYAAIKSNLLSAFVLDFRSHSSGKCHSQNDNQYDCS